MGLSQDYAGIAIADRHARSRSSRRLRSPYLQPSRRRRRQSVTSQALSVLLFGGIVLGSGTGVAGAALEASHSGRALPGVHFESVPLRGLDQAAVKSTIDSQLNGFLSAPMVFTFADREWQPSAAEMGLSIDSNAMAGEAIQLGRSAPPVLRFGTALFTTATRPSPPLRAQIDQSQLAAFLGAVALEVDRPAVNATLAARNGQLVVGQAATGRQVDVAATIEKVTAPSTLLPPRVEVVVNVLSPDIPDSAALEAQTTASRILSAPIVLKLGERSWTLSPTALGDMLEFKRVPAGAGGTGGKLAASLNEAKVATFVRAIAADIDRPLVEAQLRWNGSGVTVVRPSAEGVKLDQPATVRAVVSQAQSDNRDVTLTTTVTKPAVASDAATISAIKQLISTGTSKFAGSSPERVNNIKVAASRLHGVVIPAGATFSFLSSLGPITKENGYQEGLTIQGDATVPGVGGGVCQVSTTAFRAAFYAGLPIVERHQHTYRVSYYEQDGSPVGFDAAVYDPGVDLRFKNDTDAPIIIQTGIDLASSTLTFSFFGAPTGREVKLAPSKANEIKPGPRLPDGTDPSVPRGVRKQVEWSADGVDATIRRTVTQQGKTLLSDSFFSRYVPWREKWVVGTG